MVKNMGSIRGKSPVPCDVAFSFQGKELANKTLEAKALLESRGVSCFHDWRGSVKDDSGRLAPKLAKQYKTALLCVIFVNSRYFKERYPRYEWSIIMNR
ncbi:MAG: hypothetical protein WC655_28100, partial [Candidatus Hydrogenedentales bacterium]